MKNNNLIAINGKINSGKDTIGNIIQIFTALPHLTDTGVKSFLGREIDSPYKIKKFADKLKDMVCLLIGCTREQLEVREFKEKELGEEWWYWKENITGKIIKPFIGKEINDFILVKLTPRLLLQLLGTECGREILHPNIWVNSLFAEYKAYKPIKTVEPLKKFELGENIEYPKWCITDLRFPNELEAIKQRNGITIRVEREYQNPLMPETSIPEHPSETSLDHITNWDYVIDNNGTIEELIKKVREILNKENII